MKSMSTERLTHLTCCSEMNYMMIYMHKHPSLANSTASRDTAVAIQQCQANTELAMDEHSALRTGI